MYRKRVQIGKVTIGTTLWLRVKLAVSGIQYYAAFFFCCFSFAHLARWNAAIFLRADADIVRFGFVATTLSSDEARFAQRFRCAAAIFSRAAPLILRRLSLGFVEPL
jgi:hypothetical protein